MNVASRACSGSTFDPFLLDMTGAEVVQEAEGIERALTAMRDREVLVGTDAGDLVTARLFDPLTLIFDEHAAITVGDEIAVSDHRGVHYVGFRAVVGAVIVRERGSVVRLFRPRIACFFPGRRHVRLEGTLGADVVVEAPDLMAPARGIDVSVGGIGVVVPMDDGFKVGQVLLVHLCFPEEHLTLPACVRTATATDDEVRLGLEFATCSEELARHLRSAFARA